MPSLQLKLAFLILTAAAVNHAQTNDGSYLHDSERVHNAE